MVMGFAVMLGDALPAQSPVHRLTAISQQVAQRGTTVALRVESADFAGDLETLRFSHPLIEATAVPGPEVAFSQHRRPQPGHFSVTIAPQVPPGLYEVVAVGAFGVSNPLPFRVTEAPVQVLASAPREDQDPQPLTLGTWTQVTPSNEQHAHLAFDVPAGRRLEVKVLAEPLDSRAVARLQVFGPDQRLVVDAVARDGRDVSRTRSVEKPGRHTLLLSDFLFRGGPTMKMVVRVDAPEPGSEGDVPFFDAWLHGNPLTPAGRSAGPVAALPQLRDPDWLTMPTPRGDETVTRVATGHDPASPHELVVPTTVEGVFRATGAASEHYRIALQEGQKITAEVLSQRLGQLTDPRILIFDEPAADAALPTQPLAENDDLPRLGIPATPVVSRDPRLDFTAPREGRYRIVVEDRMTTQLEPGDRGYLLRVTEMAPSVQVAGFLPFEGTNPAQSRPAGTRLRPGMTQPIELLVDRRGGYNGAITVAPVQLPTGVTATPCRIEPGAATGLLVLQAGKDVAEEFLWLDLTAKPEGLADATPQPVWPLTIRWEPQPQRNVIDARLATSLPIAIDDAGAPPLRIAFPEPEEPLSVKPGESVTLPIRVERTDRATQPVVVRGVGFPKGLSMPEVKLEKGSPEGQCVWKAAADAPVGELTLHLRAETTATFSGNAARVKTAEDDLQRLVRIQQVQPELEGLQAAIDAAKKHLDEVTKETKPFDRSLFILSPPIRLNIVPK